MEAVDVDLAYLRGTSWPGYEHGGPSVRLVDLFAGCGGLTLGVAEAARQAGMRLDIQLAVDFDADAIEVYRHNFRKLDPRATCATVESHFDGALGAPPSVAEHAVRDQLGERPHLLVGGPPCQGHSDLNNRSRRDDARNAFYARMARAAEVLAPDVVVIENVPSVQHDRQGVVKVSRQALLEAGYGVDERIVAMHRIGVPQMRRRHVLLAIREDLGVLPGAVLASLGNGPATRRDLAWAVRDLADMDQEKLGPLDRPSTVTEVNRQRISYMTERGIYELPDSERPACHRNGGHSYRSVYGRLRWDQPAQTITSGYGSMGQGRYVHPDQPRTLTPHEAARLQFFPDWFDFTANGAVTRRTSWAAMIGNAVPPRLMSELAAAVIPAMLTADGAPDR